MKPFHKKEGKIKHKIKSHIFPVVMYGYERDYKQSRVLKNCFFWTVVMEKTLEGPLDCKEIKPVYPKGNQSWIFIGRTDAEAETPILWPPDVKNWLIGKDPDAGKDWRQEKAMTDGWMASLTRWTWVWVSSRSWWWTEKPGMLQSKESQRVGHDWVTELNWTYGGMWGSLMLNKVSFSGSILNDTVLAYFNLLLGYL